MFSKEKGEKVDCGFNLVWIETVSHISVLEKSLHNTLHKWNTANYWEIILKNVPVYL